MVKVITRHVPACGFVLVAIASCVPAAREPSALKPIPAAKLVSAFVETVCTAQLQACCTEAGFGFDQARCLAITRATWAAQIDKRLRTRGASGYSPESAAKLLATLGRAVASCDSRSDVAILETDFEDGFERLFARGNAKPGDHCESSWDCTVSTADGKPVKGGRDECVVAGSLAEFLRDGSECQPFYPARNGRCHAAAGFASDYCEDEGTYCDAERCVSTAPDGADCSGREMLPNVCGPSAFCGRIKTPTGVRSVCQKSPRVGETCDERHLCDGNAQCTNFPDGQSRCWPTHTVVNPQTCGLSEAATGRAGGG